MNNVVDIDRKEKEELAAKEAACKELMAVCDERMEAQGLKKNKHGIWTENGDDN